MRKLLLLCGALLCLLVPALAQKQVTGKVTDSKDGTPLAGVSVKVKGTNVGVSTGADGTYSVEMPKNASVLIFSSVGYADFELTPGSGSTDVQLVAGSKNLEEVVVVGYGTRIKKDVTSSLTRVTSKEIENLPLPSFAEGLQGRASGVYINTGSGKLGQGINIRVRGISSISANQQPFVVIDGVPVVSQSLGSATEPDNPLATLNPDDIASMEVLKDASSAAIYGARAGNGVILITTKSGRQGKTRLSAGYYTGWSQPTRKGDFLNSAQYKELFTAAAENMGYNPEEEFNGESGTEDWTSGVDTKWSDLAFQNGTINQYNAQLTGGDARTKFLLSASYNDQVGVLNGNKLTRGTVRLNLDHSIGKFFKVGANINLGLTKNYRVPSDNAFSNPIQLNALPPLHPVYDADGNYNNATLYYNNLIELEGNNHDISKTIRTISSAYGEWNINPYLRFRSQVGLDLNNLQEDNFLGARTLDGAPNGYSYNNQVTASVFTWSNTLNYSKDFGADHNLEALLGTEYQDGNTNGASVTGRAFPSDRFTKIASAAIISAGSSTQTEFSFVSYFARANYKYKDRLLLGGSVRVDGSSRFGTDNRYGTFPAVSAGYIFIDQSLKSSPLPVLSFLKLRSSYGLTGNAEIPNFASLTLFSASAYADISGIYASQMGNNQLKWEKTKQFDVGLDFGLFKNRLTGEIDYFNKNTDDLLLNVPLPAINGFTTVTTNIGSMKNSGWEFVLNGAVLTGEFKWNISANLSTYKNEITKLVTPVAPSSRTLGRLAVGQPFGQFYGKKYMGVDPQNGDALYMGADGKATNDYDAAPDTIIGNPNPKFYGGFSNRFSYKGFDLDITCQFVEGNDLYNIAGFFQSVNGDYFDNQTTDQLNYWKEEGDKTSIPQPRLYEGNGAGKSSRWVQDGSYFRLKSINLGYNFPRKWLTHIKMESARVYVAAYNLLTLTDYIGYDPEVNTTYVGNVNLGHDFYTPPQARTISVGVNVGF